MTAIVGALRVVLGADTAALDKGLKDAQSGLASFGAAVGAGMAAAAAAAVAAGTAISVALGKTINDMDTLGKTSQKLGIPVEQLSALAYAADLSDVSFEALSKGVGKLSKAMVEAGAKPTSEAASAFKALGVSVTDASGRLKSSDVVMGDIAEAFSGLKDGAGKTAVAMAIFGKSGADMIPLLNGGRASLKEMKDEAAQFGAILSTKAAKQAEAFNDNMTKLGYAIKGVFVQVASQLLPILVDFSNKMVESAKNSGILASTVDILSSAMKGLVTSGVLVSATLQVAADVLSVIWGGLARLIKGDVSGAFDLLKTKTSDISTVATETLATLQGVWSGAKSGADSAAAATDGAAKAQRDFNYAALGGKNAVDSYIDSQNKALAGQRAEIQTFGMLTGQREAARIQLQALAIAANGHTAITATQQARLDLLKQTTSEYALKLAGLQTIQANMSPSEIYLQELAKIEAQLKDNAISADQFRAAQQRLAENVQSTWNTAGASMAGGFAQLAQEFGKHSKAMATTAKVFGVIEATINTYTAFTKALSSAVPPFNYALAAGVLAAGMAKVSAISSMSIPSFSTGGFVSGAGTSISDSIPAMLSNGEFVVNAEATQRNRSELEAMNSGRTAAKTVSVNFNGIVGREGVARLLEEINSLLGDGYELKMA